MKRFLCTLFCSGTLLCGADLSTVHTVYVLPMAGGLDQYLANRLTNEHTFQVVTDPKPAEAFFTDRIGASFQAQMEVLFPPPPPPEKPAAKAEKSEKSDKRSRTDDAPPGLMTDTVNKLGNPAATSSIGRGKGTIFLVDAKSRQVIWSTYVPPKTTQSSDLDRIASDIVTRLKKDMNPKAKN